MNCSYKLNESDVVSAMQLHGRGTNRTLMTLSIGGIGLVLLGAFTSYKTIAFGAAIGGLIGYFAVLWFLIPFKAKKQYKENRTFRHEISMTLSDQGINFKSESGESKLQWSHIHKWKESNGIYLLYITSNMFHMVPSRGLSNNSELPKLLNENVGAKTA